MENNPLAFSFQLTEKMPVRIELLACNVIVTDELDTSFAVVVNEKVILSSFHEKDCGFHKVICNILEETVKEEKMMMNQKVVKSIATAIFTITGSISSICVVERNWIIRL